MGGCGGGCLSRMAALVVLAVIVVAAWRFGPELADRYGHHLDSGEAPGLAASPEVADAALSRFGEVADAVADSAVFDAVDLESLLRYRWNELLPPGVADPSVRIEDGELRLRVQVALEILPRLPEIERLRGFLPDTVPVEVRGALLTLDGREGAFLVRRLDAAGVPLPRQVHGPLIEAIQAPRRDGLPDEAFSFPFPPGVGSVHLDGSRLVVHGHR